MKDDMNMAKEGSGDSSTGSSSKWDWGTSGSNSWAWGALLILTGGVLLLQNIYPQFNIINAGNWWAVLLLVPGGNMIWRGWHEYRRSSELWGPLLWGVMLVGFALTQLLGSFGEYFWPAVLVLGGLILLLGGRRN